jgi:hypothetical protein
VDRLLRGRARWPKNISKARSFIREEHTVIEDMSRRHAHMRVMLHDDVISMLNAMMIYRVEYEDSQIEDYSLQELQDILVE